jgi:hypothetical protein
VDVAESFARACKNTANRGFVRDIASDLDRATSDSFDLLCGGADKIGAASRSDHISASDGEAFG